jgi:hypothetical protein
MIVKNKTLISCIKEILKKEITPIKIYRSQIGERFTIEIQVKEPTAFISILYGKELDRDQDFLVLDEQVFDILPFNPYIYPIPPLPHGGLPPLPPLYTPPYPMSNGPMVIQAKFFWDIFRL